MPNTSSKRKLIPLLVLAVAALIIFLLVATKPTPPTQEIKEKEWLVSAQTLSSTQVKPQIKLLGTVSSPFNSTLTSAISADVISVPVRDGQFVRKDEPLVQLDLRELNLKLSQQEADVAELKAQLKAEKNRYAADLEALKEEERLLEIATQGVKRQAKLQASNLVAQERYDSAESQRAQQALSINARKLNIADHPNRLAQLQARLRRAETALNDTRLDVERASIKAPFDGVVTNVAVSPGERVQIGQALVSLYDRSNVEVRAQLPDRHVQLIKTALDQNIPIQATTYSYGNASDLRLSRLSGQANLRGGGLDAIFTPAAEDIQLVLNSALEIHVSLPELEQVYTLPVSAIYGTDRVYRISDGRLSAAKVKIEGYRYDADGQQSLVIVSSPMLANGDLITSTQLPNAISGLKVQLRDASPKETNQ